MKKLISIITIALISLFFSFKATAQRSIDLEAKITSPASGTTVLVNQPLTVTYRVTNHGADTLKISDSFRLYVIIDGDSLIFNLNPFEQYKVVTNHLLLPSHFYHPTFTMAFDPSLAGNVIDFCFAVVPINAGDPIVDPDMSNNKHCISLDISDGTASVPETISAVEQTTISPNPASTTIYLHHPDDKLKTIEIYDPMGRKIKSETMSGKENVLDISQLSPGIYFIKIISDRMNEEPIKIFKN